MTRDFNQPSSGITNWHTPLNQNFADLGIEVADEVATWSDLPAPSGETSSYNNPRTYYVREARLYVADAGDSWRILAGLGSGTHPLPYLNANTVSVTDPPSAANDVVRKYELDNLDASSLDAIPASQKGTADGVATLDSNAELVANQVPSIAITDVYVINTESDLTNLSATQGDVGIATQENGSWILTTDDPTTASNWKELQRTEPPVSDVFGRTGSVTAQSGDYQLDEIGNVDAKAMLEGPDADKPAAGTTGRYYFATDVDLLYRDNGTSWEVKAGHGTSSNPVPGTTHLESVSTDRSIINGPGRDIDQEPLDSVTSSSTSFSLSTGESGPREYALRYEFLTDSATGDCFIRLNGDGATTGNYSYFDESGAGTTGANEFPICTTSGGFVGVSGWVYIRQNGPLGRIYLDNRFSGRVGRVSSYGDNGDWGGSGDLSSVEITLPSNNGGATADLYRIIG